MKIKEKYIEALKALDDWVIISEWAAKVAEMYPEILARADIQAANQAHDTTGLREIAARISSLVSSGSYLGRVEIDATESPKRVRYVTRDEFERHAEEEVQEDVAPLRRAEIERRDFAGLSAIEKYRLEELQAISRQLKSFYGLDFELDHAKALLNGDAPGSHHPDNLQFLLKQHNARKNNANWPRFSIDEQIHYIRAAVALQKTVMGQLGYEDQEDVLNSLLDRIANVYGSAD